MSLELSAAAEYIGWLKTKSHLNTIVPNASRRFVRRGQVYWCHFGLNIGSEMSKQTPRPAVVVQNYSGNRSSSNTIVVPVTHTASTLPCVVQLDTVTDADGGTVLDGYADTSHIICVSKARLGDLIATLPPAQMRRIDKGIAISLGLMEYYDREVGKYERLTAYSERVKQDRNAAQDKLQQIKEAIELHGFDAECQEKLKNWLDIQ